MSAFLGFRHLAQCRVPTFLNAFGVPNLEKDWRKAQARLQVVLLQLLTSRVTTARSAAVEFSSGGLLMKSATVLCCITSFQTSCERLTNAKSTTYPHIGHAVEIFNVLLKSSAAGFGLWKSSPNSAIVICYFLLCVSPDAFL